MPSAASTARPSSSMMPVVAASNSTAVWWATSMKFGGPVVCLAVRLANQTWPSRTSASQLYSGPSTACSTSNRPWPPRRPAAWSKAARSATCSTPRLPAEDSGLITTGSRSAAQSRASVSRSVTRKSGWPIPNAANLAR